MSNITAPKTEGRISEIKKALKVYSKSSTPWLSNDEYIKKIKRFTTVRNAAISSKTGKEDLSWYTAICQIPTYFGIIEINPTNNKKKRLSRIGLQYYNALLKNNKKKQKDILFNQIEQLSFGRNNNGATRSDSDYELPRIALKAIYDFEPLKKSDLTKILYYVIEKNLGYNVVKTQIQSERAGNPKWKFGTTERAENKYLSDPKFIEFLIDNDIIIDINKKNNHRPTYCIPSDIRKLYGVRIDNLELTNRAIITSAQDVDEIEYAEEQTFNSSKILTSAELALRALKKPIPCSSGKTKRYRTDPDVSRTALHAQKYECQCGGKTHGTFLRKDGLTPYIEGHHVIPMKAQKDYPNDTLDIIDNIVGLCPNCHKKVHHGSETDIKDVLKKIYTPSRIAALAKFSIPDVDTLYNKYYK